MARWKYQICQKQIESTNDREQLQRVLDEYGDRGWELVQILPKPDDGRYELIFKSGKPLIPPR